MSDRDPQQWRDARFRKALDSAPDGAERPPEAVREAILSKARATAAEAAAAKIPPQRKRAGWWSLGLPWNSALGTVAVVCLVSVLWWREDLPKQAEEAAPAAMPSQVLAPAPASAPASEEATVSKVAVGKAKEEQARHAAQRAKVESSERAAAELKQLEAQGDASTVQLPAPMQAFPQRAAPPRPPHIVVAAPVPAPAAVQPALPPQPAPVATPAPAPKPVQALPYARSSDAALERVTVAGRRIEAVAWTSLRVRTPSGAVLLANDELSGQGQILLQQQLRDQRRAADQAASGVHMLATSQPPGLVVEVLDEDRVVARLELVEGQLREQVEAALASKPR